MSQHSDDDINRIPPFQSLADDVYDDSRVQATEQTQSPAFKLAFADTDLLMRDELRPVRLQLELLKPGLLLHEQKIESTISVFGSARIQPRAKAKAALRAAEEALALAPQDNLLQEKVNHAKKTLKYSRFYEDTKTLARLISDLGQKNENYKLVVMTGGGPGIMEAANRGAFEAGAKSIGLNILLPHEQAPNAYITPELCFQFHYFAIRKMHFLIRSKALVAFPGGFGTVDELFTTLTLMQTGKISILPIILYHREFWDKLIHWDFFLDEGLISAKDLQLIHYAESPEDVITLIKDFYEINPA